MPKALKITLVLALFGLLVLVRAFEDVLFYDPLLGFFKGEYTNHPLPKMDTLALFLGVFFRFFLNTIISLAILWLIFKDRGIIKLSVFLYGLFFILLFLAFSFIIYTSEETGGHLLLFYVRRFLIQPLFLLVLLPAFYFQKSK